MDQLTNHLATTALAARLRAHGSERRTGYWSQAAIGIDVEYRDGVGGAVHRKHHGVRGVGDDFVIRIPLGIGCVAVVPLNRGDFDADAAIGISEWISHGCGVTSGRVPRSNTFM